MTLSSNMKKREQSKNPESNNTLKIPDTRGNIRRSSSTCVVSNKIAFRQSLDSQKRFAQLFS